MKNHYSSMRKNILTIMILVTVIPFLLILGIGYYYFTTSIETSSVASMKRIVEDHRQMIETFLQERKADLGLICNSYAFEDLSGPEKIRDVFNHLQEVSNAFVDLGVFNGEGVHVAYYGPYELEGMVYGETEWFREVIKKGYYISDVFLGYRKVPHFIIAIAKGEGSKKWVVRATIDTLMFNELVKKVRIGQTGEAYIMNRDGIFQTERRSGGSLMSQESDNGRYLSYHSGIRTFLDADSEGEKYLYATTWLKEGDWLLVIRQMKEDAFKSLRSAAYLIILITVIGGGIITGLAFYLTDRIIKKMEQMDADRESLSGQLIWATQLAELGEMAAGFAHEINNPLQIINNEQTLMLDILTELKEKGELKESDSLAEIEDSMREIHVQIARCTKITQAILKFGRKSEPVSGKIDVDKFINEITSVIDQKASVHGIKIYRDILEDIPLIKGDPGQLQQVFLNLFNNAIDAVMARHGSAGGELNITARPKENGMVEIFVKDNGTGISPENMKKIFSPFFTTKPVGKGTGLGLSVCYGIINDMGGVMEVSSEYGKGTTFLIDLPAAE
ncbi:ATP-binding protein [Deltaproteobacteria bacterium]|nr:ATP-binding protein [Deltaproteobacteria bacterium]